MTWRTRTDGTGGSIRGLGTHRRGILARPIRADETAADPDCPSEKSSSWYLDLERARPGAGVAALCAELRELVVSLGVNIGLSPAGLPEELRRALAADAR